MKLLLLSFIIICCIANAKSQSHTFKSGWCRFAKPVKGSVQAEVASFVCQACAKDKETEQKAKATEDKRRADILAAEYKAKKDAAARAAALKKIEDAKNAHSGEVTIEMPKNNAITPKSVPVKIASNVTDKTIIIGRGIKSYTDQEGYFTNEKKERILGDKNWSWTLSVKEQSYSAICDSNVGIVKIGDLNGYWKAGSYRYDIVNSKGEFTFNDDKIVNILHINDGWFIYCKLDNPKSWHLYNINTKKNIELENFSTASDITSTRIYVPIFSNTVKLSNLSAHSGSIINSIVCSESIKKELIGKFPSQINEKILGSYSFCLLHTNYTAESLCTYRFDRAGFTKMVLYCFTKNGTLTKINLL